VGQFAMFHFYPLGITACVLAASEMGKLVRCDELSPKAIRAPNRASQQPICNPLSLLRLCAALPHRQVVASAEEHALKVLRLEFYDESRALLVEQCLKGPPHQPLGVFPGIDGAAGLESLANKLCRIFQRHLTEIGHDI
jgi:hypothetical protein